MTVEQVRSMIPADSAASVSCDDYALVRHACRESCRPPPRPPPPPPPPASPRATKRRTTRITPSRSSPSSPPPSSAAAIIVAVVVLTKRQAARQYWHRHTRYSFFPIGSPPPRRRRTIPNTALPPPPEPPLTIPTFCGCLVAPSLQLVPSPSHPARPHRRRLSSMLLRLAINAMLECEVMVLKDKLLCPRRRLVEPPLALRSSSSQCCSRTSTAVFGHGSARAFVWDARSPPQSSTCPPRCLRHTSTNLLIRTTHLFRGEAE